MRRGLIIFLAVMALIFSVILCACEKPEYIDDPSVDPNGNLTYLSNDAGVVITGDSFPRGTTIELKEITDKEILDEVTQATKSSDHYLFGDNYVVSIIKIIDVSLYDGNNKLEVSNRLNYTIPISLLGVDSSICYQCALFKITDKNMVKYIDVDRINEEYFSFKSFAAKYLVVVKWEEAPCKHVNISEFDDGYPATIFNSGLKPHYYCWDCRNYIDENMNIVTYDDLVIPKRSRNIDLYVNGEKKSTFKEGEEGEHHTINWELTGVSLNAGDSISLISQDEEPITYAIEPQYETNIDKKGKIRSDVESATLKLYYDGLHWNSTSQEYSEKMYLWVSGVNYYYFGNVSRTSLTWDAIEDTRDNGIISFNNVSPNPGTYEIYYRTDDGLTKIENVVFTKAEATSAISIYTDSVRFNKSGLYNVTYNTNTNTAEISVIETFYDMFWVYEWEGERKNFPYYSYRKYGIRLSSYTELTNLFVQNAGDKISFYDSDYSTNAIEVTIADNSKEFIKYNDEDKSVEFIKNGVYELTVSFYNREISVKRKGDLAYKFRAYIFPTNAGGASPIILEKTQIANLYEISPDFLIYPGDKMHIDNEYDSVHDYFELSDSNDAQYAYVINNRALCFAKGGKYKIIFDAETKKIDLVLIRELTEDEALIPTNLVLFAEGDYYSQTQYDLVVNSENKDELYAVITIDRDRSYIDSSSKNSIKFLDKDKRIISECSIDAALAEKACIHETYSQISIYFYKAGKYIVYINKTTYSVRVEEVIA